MAPSEPEDTAKKIAALIGPEGILLGLDRDPLMPGHSAKRIHGHNCYLRHASYSEIKEGLSELMIETVDRILLDLGLSSDQLADRDRRFGYSLDAPLDMRFDVMSGLSAKDLLNTIDEASLERILTTYGEELMFWWAGMPRILPILLLVFGSDFATCPIESLRDGARPACWRPAVADGVGSETRAQRVISRLTVSVVERTRLLRRRIQVTLKTSPVPGCRSGNGQLRVPVVTVPEPLPES